MSNATEFLHATAHWQRSLSQFTPIPHLLLPNLRVFDILFSLRNVQNDVQIYVIVINDGNAKSGPCQLELQTSLNHQRPVTQSVDCPPIAPLELWGKEFSLQNVPVNADLIAIATVDPATPGNPGGSVWESNETDNTLIVEHFVDV